jgi:hypothetical protein
MVDECWRHLGLSATMHLRARSLGLNVNSVWGAVLLVFVAIMAIPGRRAMAIHPDSDSPAGGASRTEDERR